MMKSFLLIVCATFCLIPASRGFAEGNVCTLEIYNAEYTNTPPFSQSERKQLLNSLDFSPLFVDQYLMAYAGDNYRRMDFSIREAQKKVPPDGLGAR
jgi:hypothetical protein